MIMAPRMIQAMEILQLPLLALQERIDQELIANPVLEIRGEGEEPPPPADETDESPSAPLAEPERDLVVREGAQTEDFERLSNVVDRWENYFEEDADSFRRSRPAAGDADPKAEAMQNAPEAGATLQEHLLGLWHVEGLDKRATALGELIIRNLDDSGYLRVPLEELAAEAEPPASVEEMTEVLEEVQRTGPLGVGARDLTECLLLQLQGRPGLDGPVPDDSLDARIIRDHLHDVEANRFPQIAQALHATIEEVKEAVDRIRHLNPRPGSVISPRKTPPIVPDVRIEWDEEVGQFRVTVLSGGSPELYISGAYRRLVKQEGLDPKTRQFVSQNIRSAQWLMEAIELRRDTLRRVTESIVRFQRRFLRGRAGPSPAPQDAAGGRRRAPARLDHQPRGRRQVRRHAVGHLAAARFLHRRHPDDRERRRRQLGRGPGAPQGPGRRRGQEESPLGRGPHETPDGRRHRQTLPPHRGQVPRGTRHPGVAQAERILMRFSGLSRTCPP